MKGKGAERMYVAIRQYGLLTNEPVENVLQGIREGFIPIIKCTGVFGLLRTG
jgi:hypothetical protein